ncbi:hypothetical protein OAL00_06680 [Verrucomicrobiales bacterium]|nr:hypothetical protein [Verrucomicrobiales bacterium]
MTSANCRKNSTTVTRPRDQFTGWKGDLVPGEERFTIYYLLNFNNFQYWNCSGESSLPIENDVPHFDFRRARFILPTAVGYPQYRVPPGWGE